MNSSSLDYSKLFAKDLPGPSSRSEPDPPYNFTYGHGSPDLLPIEGFVDAAADVFQEGRAEPGGVPRQRGRSGIFAVAGVSG